MSTTRSTPSAPGATESPEPSLGVMVGAVTEDLGQLVRDHIALAKREVSDGVRLAAASSAMVAAAAFVAVLALVFLLVTIAYALVAAGLPVWAGFGIVTLLLVIVAAVLGLVGSRRLRAVHGPEHTTHEIVETRAALLSRQRPPAS